MFDALARQPDDPLLALIGLFRKDERSGKVDLGVGVYRDETGRTPI
ncbi:MAG: aromatic amino acid aminotransferase, partial [Sinorhizobium fredii]|nr:aromatic amino acid aminotransferase [Sinorhizobium fredii]